MSSRKPVAGALRRVALLAVVPAAAMVFIGCSSDDDGSAANGSSDQAAADDAGAESDDTSGGSDGDSVACDLVTAEDVEGLGYTVESGPEPNELAPGDECGVKVVDSRGGGATVALTVYSESEAVALGPDLYPDSETVDGVGAEAWYNDNLHLVQVRLEDGRVVSIQDVAGEASKENMIALADMATGRT